MNSWLVRFALMTGALLGASRAIPAQDAPAPASRPNVLLVIVDDLGWRDLSCYGSTLFETPRIDRLATEGMRFTDAYVAYPRCVPSRFAMMTGRYPARFQGRRDGMHVTPGRDVTVGALFAQAGYATFYCGKWHLGEGESAPSANGFPETIAAGAAGATRSHFAPYTVSRRRGGGGGEGEERALITGLDDAPEGEYLADRQTTETIKFIRAHRDGPFFAVHAFYAVHTPIEGKEEYTEVYRRKLAAQPPPSEVWERESAGENLLVQNNPVYAAMVQSVDDNVGRLMDALEELRIAENTIVLLISDNGGLSSRGRNREMATSNRPLRAGKGHLYEGGVRVPLILRWPGVAAAGRATDVPVIGVDLMPTLVELAGLPSELPAGIDGVSFAGLVRGATPPSARPLFWHNPAPRPNSTGDNFSSSLRAGSLKLIEFPQEKRVELYDLAQDLGEARNLAAERPEETQKLLEQLEAWRREVGAAAPR